MVNNSPILAGIPLAAGSLNIGRSRHWWRQIKDSLQYRPGLLLEPMFRTCLLFIEQCLLEPL